MTEAETVSLRKIQVENYLLWKNAELPVKKGITRIMGDNRTGKTLLVNALKQAWWGSQGGKRGTDAAKMPKKAKVVITMSRRRSKSKKSDIYDITATNSKVSIKKNGESLGFSGKADSRAELQQFVGNMPLSLYESMVHLSNRYAHPLVEGTPQSRLNWIGDVFGINEKYDEMLRKIEKRLSKVRGSGAVYESLKEDWKALKREELPVIKVSSEKLTERKAEAAEELTKLNEIQAAHNKREELRIACLGYKSEKELSRELKKTRHILENAYEFTARMENWGEYRSRFIKWKRKYLSLQSRLEEIPEYEGTKTKKQLERSIEKKQKLLSDNEENKELWEEEEPFRAAAFMANKIRKKKGKNFTLADIMRSKAKYEAKYQNSQDLLHGNRKLALGLTSHICPCCGSKVKPEQMKKHFDKIVKENNAYVDKLKELEEVLPIFEKAEKVTMKEPPLSEKEESRARRLLKKQRTIIQDMEEREKLREAIQEWKEQKPKKVQKPEESDDYDIAALQEKSELLAGALTAFRKLKAMPKPPAFNKERLQELRDKVEGLQVRIVKTARMETERELLIRRRKELKAKKLETKEKAGMENMLLTLKRAYSFNGLRLSRVKEAAGKLEQALNRFSSLLWNDPIKFRMNIGESGISLLAERNGEEGDLTTLSGSEEKCWRALCAFSLLALLPARKKVDFIILDEIESNLDETSRYKFARDFLPALKEMAPRVIVVSPLSEEEFAVVPDYAYKTVKKGAVSELIRVK